MRDGVELSTDLYLPEQGLDGGPFPVVLLRTEANNQHPSHTALAKQLADQGFAVALQDVRGRHDSQGSFRPFRDEARDGHDTVEWLAAQSWCDGKVGMMGAGYAGFCSWAAAGERPPHLVTLVSTAPMGGWQPGLVPLPMVQWLHANSARVWQEGRQVDWERVLQVLPLGAMPDAIGARMPTWREWLDPEQLQALWSEVLLTQPLDLPVLHVKGWYDGSAADRYLEAMRGSSAQQHLLAGPWDHVSVLEGGQHLGGVDFGKDAVVDIADVHVRWFDKHLRGGDQKLVTRRFTTGTGTWREGDAATTDQVLHLSSATLGTHPGDDPDSFRYDPAHPVVIGDDLRFFPSPPVRWVEPSLDRRFVERRDDVLTYTSEELSSTTEVLGSPTVTLHTSSDCPDTDWFVEVTDVAPSGASQSVAFGAARAVGPRSAGQVYELEIPLPAVNHAFQAGHRIRLLVTSSRFPSYPRNLNTGDPIADATEQRVATNTVHHDAAHPSRLVLPVVTA
jgi:putative CocE/NonD family hydrolase